MIVNCMYFNLCKLNCEPVHRRSVFVQHCGWLTSSLLNALSTKTPPTEIKPGAILWLVLAFPFIFLLLY